MNRSGRDWNRWICTLSRDTRGDDTSVRYHTFKTEGEPNHINRPKLMTERSRQTTLDSPTGEISSLDEIDWTYKNADTQYLTHGLHPYPARMIPQIPATLLDYFKQVGTIEEGDRVYDPFSGSGTTAVEGRLHGLHTEANDINPFACMLTLAKAVPIEDGLLDEAHTELTDGLSEDLANIRDSYDTDTDIDIELPEVRRGWFPMPQLIELCHLRDRIDEIEDDFGEDVSRLFRIALAKTTRDASYQRNGEYKRYRIPEEARKDHDPNVGEIFTTQLNDNVERVKRYSREVDPDLSSVVHYADSRQAADVSDNSADIVITSPPYGDHSTTVAYGQFSQDPAIIAGQFGYDEMKEVDKAGLGGTNRVLEKLDELEEWSDSLRTTLEVLREEDGRAEDAMQFFRDYFEVMRQVARILKPGQPVAWVVANRTISRVSIPTHLITHELCERLGFVHEHTLPREIPTKTLPWENAPENVPGLKGNLMANENIVVMMAPNE